MIKSEIKKLKILSVFMLIFFSLSSCRDNEFELLLSIRASINDPLQTLSNWNSSVSFCHWSGIVCDSSSHVVKIELSGKNISGRIPESVFQFPHIETIDLSNNQLFGRIPSNLSSCLFLRYLNLSNNNFTGPLPEGSISGLETIDLSNNMLSGKITEDIGTYTGLKILDFGGNVLVGSIPKSIANLKRLQFLTLSSNQLDGEIPRELGSMKSLKLIYLGHNNFSGGIPKEIGELTSLYHLDLVNNNLTGEIPSSIGNLTSLQYLFLYLNKLTGSIPQSIFNLKGLISLDLSDNFLSGKVPELVIQLKNLEILHLFSNNFTGKIPKSLTYLPKLQVLQLWSNKFSGEIPKGLGKQSNLTVVDLSTNHLTGKIPKALCESGHLFKLILFSNNLEGEIPLSLSHCKSLERLRLQNNRFSGELPLEFTKLPLVYFLDISENNISGTINGRKWDMPQLQMLNLARNNFFGDLPESFGSSQLQALDLSANGFSGGIPSNYGNISELMELNISKNNLSGNIPDELSSCKKLVSLDLSHNQLKGEIPTSLSEMPVLEQLDLSMNQLFGEIPSNLGKVDCLVQVNISHNHFHGSLPSTGAFFAINSSAVSGNNLCGGVAVTGLPPCKEVRNPVGWLFLTCFFSTLLVFGLVAASIYFFCRRQRSKGEVKKSEYGIWEIQYFDPNRSNSITMDDILSSIKEENSISRGNPRFLYEGKSSKSDMQFIVEKTNFITFPIKLWAETADQLRKLRHPYVVKALMACKSEKIGFLVYEYIEGKTLSEAIRGLNWESRKRIAIGIAKAIRYLHCDCSPSIVLGDLSPEKVIVVDGKDEPCLKLILAGLVRTDTKCFTSSVYMSPEIMENKDMTEMSDIYGFGLILIELLTGKSPATGKEFGMHGGIIEWARHCYSDYHLETWIDPIIKEHALNNPNRIIKIMNLALRCTADDPTARPCTKESVKILGMVLGRSRSCVLGLKFPS